VTAKEKRLGQWNDRGVEIESKDCVGKPNLVDPDLRFKQTLENSMENLGIFAVHQPIYAERNIPTFPLRDSKVPAIGNYTKGPAC
jgi:hypothetical protein